MISLNFLNKKIVATAWQPFSFSGKINHYDVTPLSCFLTLLDVWVQEDHGLFCIRSTTESLNSTAKVLNLNLNIKYQSLWLIDFCAVPVYAPRQPRAFKMFDFRKKRWTKNPFGHLRSQFGSFVCFSMRGWVALPGAVPEGRHVVVMETCLLSLKRSGKRFPKISYFCCWNNQLILIRLFQNNLVFNRIVTLIHSGSGSWILRSR